MWKPKKDVSMTIDMLLGDCIEVWGRQDWSGTMVLASPLARQPFCEPGQEGDREW